MSDAPLRILLADDDSMLRTAMTDLLATFDDIELVAAVPDGACTLDVLSNRLVDIALLDADMPVLDGIATTRTIRSRYPSVTVVILTAFEHEGDLGRALAAGATGFLTKDLPISRMIPLLRDARSGNTVMGPKPMAMLSDSYRAQASRREEEAAFLEAVDALPEHLRDVFEYMVRATPNPQIAERLGLSGSSVRTYASRVLQLTGATSRADLVISAAAAGLI